MQTVNWDTAILSSKFFPFPPLTSFPVSLLQCAVITKPSWKDQTDLLGIHPGEWCCKVWLPVTDQSCCVKSTSTSTFATLRTESCVAWTIQWSDIHMSCNQDIRKSARKTFTFTAWRSRHWRRYVNRNLSHYGYVTNRQPERGNGKEL